MYNLLITLGVSAAVFALGALAGKWTYGVAPALLAAPAVYFVLARRSGRQLEQIFGRAMAQLQERQVDEAKATIRSAWPLARWQFLVGAQISAQLGSLEYLQRNFSAARPLLEAAWTRNWQAMGMLAVLDLREGQPARALTRLPQGEWFGRKEPLFWGLRAWVMLEAGDRDGALRVLADGSTATENAEPLRELRAALANDRMKGFRWDRVFGHGWYQFFPDQIPGAAPASGPSAAQVQRVVGQDVPAAMRRGGKTWPQPKR